MTLQTQLRIPGPTPVPEEVVRAMTQPQINHRGAAFADLLKQVTRRLQWAFQTENEILVLSASGTGGLESAVVNVLSPGEKVLVASCGSFGDRVSKIAAAYGAEVVDLAVPWGQPVEPADLDALLTGDSAITAVFVTHNETSTGLTNNLGQVAEVVRRHDRLLCVDGVSSIGAINCPVDQWGIDVAVTGSQKGWMAPPGLAMVSVSARAWKRHEAARMPRFYFDWTQARKFSVDGQTPWTPALSVVYGLDAGLAMMEREGLSEVFARHQRVADAIRAGVSALGLSLYAADGYRSNTVTAVDVPPGVDAGALLRTLREKHGLVLSGGQGKLKGEIFRIGHLGLIDEADAVSILYSLEAGLREHDFAGAPEGAGVQAAQRSLSGAPVPA
ncbi:MAG: pyridoxal-phosphate-dependent aminotransferase family protein [Candidatus Dormibacteria bacterium]